MSENRRRKTAATVAVAAGLCLALMPLSLAFQLRAMHGVQVKSEGCSSSSRSHPFRGRRSAATYRKLTLNAGVLGREGEEGRHAAGVPLSSATSRHFAYGTLEKSSGSGCGGKDVATLVLSTLLLCNPRLADAASANTLASPAPYSVTQESLLADLEERLMKSSSPEQAAEELSSAAAEEETDAKTDSPATRDTATQPPPTSPTASSSVPPRASNGGEATLVAPAAPAITTKPFADIKNELSPALQSNSLGSEEQQPLVRFQEYTFSVKVPELNLKIAPVAPITVPAEGSLFSSALSFERVRPLINLSPPVGAARETLAIAGKGGGFQELARTIADFVPRQADYYRAVTELEERVRSSMKDVNHPLFASGFHLAPEFTSMFSRAKETAISAVRPYVAKGVEPELALFMLATLPVVTVALRAADEQTRRPREEPCPPGYLPPETDQNRAKARLFSSGDNAAAAAATAATATTPPTAVANPTHVLAGVEAANLEGDVAAAAAAEDGEDRLRAEMKRLQEELASATKLAAKVGALERANARLMKQVADLSRPPSREEIQRLAKREAERTRLQKEREERESGALRSVRERAERITAAREALAESFPVRGSKTFDDESETQEAEEPSAAPPLPAILANAVEDRSVAAVAGGGASSSTTPSAEALPAAVVPMEGKTELVERSVKTISTVPDRSATSSSASAGTVDFAAPPVHNGLARPEQTGEDFEVEEAGTVKGVVAGAENADSVAGVVPTVGKGAPLDHLPDDVDEVPEDLTRALRWPEDFDLDALDLEMDDLRPEDLEELHKLERDMGDVDMASLEAEFDKDAEKYTANALRLAAESALSHISGDGRRIRTASVIGATSSRGASSGSLEGPVGFEGGPGSPASEAAAPVRGVGTALYDAPLEEGAARKLFSPPAAEGEAAALRRLAQEKAGSADGKWDRRDEWRSLPAAGMKRKTVAQLKEFLDEEGVRYPSRAKKADLVALVRENISV